MKRSSAKQVEVRADATSPEKPLSPKPGRALPAAVSTCGSHADSLAFTAGIFIVAALSYAVGSAPALLPLFFLAFAVTAGPQRVATFVAKRWTFFLVDMCYVSSTGWHWPLVHKAADWRPAWRGSSTHIQNAFKPHASTERAVWAGMTNE